MGLSITHEDGSQTALSWSTRRCCVKTFLSPPLGLRFWTPPWFHILCLFGGVLDDFRARRLRQSVLEDLLEDEVLLRTRQRFGRISIRLWRLSRRPHPSRQVSVSLLVLESMGGANFVRKGTLHAPRCVQVTAFLWLMCTCRFQRTALSLSLGIPSRVSSRALTESSIVTRNSGPWPGQAWTRLTCSVSGSRSRPSFVDLRGTLRLTSNDKKLQPPEGCAAL